MTLVNFPWPNIQNGDPEDVSKIMADFNSVRDVVNGLLQNENIKADAAIAITKLILGGADTVLQSDGAANSYAKIANRHVDAAAAIAYSKLALANSILNADVAPGAAIAYSKLALANSIVNADIAAGAAIAKSKLNLAGTLTTADLAAGAGILDTQLASPNNAVYWPIFVVTGQLLPSTAGGTYFNAGDSGWTADGGSGAVEIPIYHYSAADFAVTNRTTKLNVKVNLASNTVAAGVTLTFGLYPVASMVGSGGNVGVTLGTVVPGSTVQFVAPGAGTLLTLATADFTPPADGFYVWGLVITGASVNGSHRSTIHMQLRIRHTA